MPDADSSPDPMAQSPRDFRTTHWSVVLHAGDVLSLQRGRALELLCRAYWFPLYAFVRRRGHGEEEAKDLTQGFFERLLEKNYLADADRGRGRFRTFLLAALKHFLANEWDKANARKRGGGRVVLSFEEADAEGRYLGEPLDELTPEKIFERRWAEAVLEKVFNRLRAEFDGAGATGRFEAVKPFLIGGGDGAYVEAAAQLGITESGARSVVHRLRRRFRELMRLEIAETVSRPEEVEEEIRHLLAALD